jgi:hypothetical protein
MVWMNRFDGKLVDCDVLSMEPSPSKRTEFRNKRRAGIRFVADDKREIVFVIDLVKSLQAVR